MPSPSHPGAPRRVGVDSYAYHRLLGEVRPAETEPPLRFERGSLDVVAEARALGLDFALLQTSLLGDPADFAPDDFLAQAGEVALGLSWGAPDGFALGSRPEALRDLEAWLPHAAALSLGTVRIVVGGPETFGRRVAPVVPLLREACTAAGELGLTLALENHGDLSAAQLGDLLDTVGDAVLHVCFDTANALRVGDDVGAAARELAPVVELLHLKDCAGSWDDAVTGPISVAPGEGVIPLDAVLAACPDALVCVELGQLAPDAEERLLVAAYVEYVRSR